MSEKKFKAGDRVTLQRAVDVHIDGGLTQICPGEVGIIDWTNGEDMEVYFGDYVKLELHASQVERVEPTDPRAAFLRELKELLSKYDAEILVSIWPKDATTIKPLLQIDVDGHKLKPLVWENTLNNEYAYLNADNIMDYEK